MIFNICQIIVIDFYDLSDTIGFMIIKTVKTRILKPPKDDLLEVISQSIKSLPEKSIVVITSKVVSIWQGRCVPMNPNLKK